MKPLVTLLLFPLIAAAEPGPAPRLVRLDLDGDILPPGVVARLGSTRFQEVYAHRVTVSPDGAQAVCVDDFNVRVWDLKSGKLVHVWPLPGGTLQVWRSRRFPDWQPRQFAGEVSEDGRTSVRLGQGSDGAGVAAVADVWDLPAGRKVRTLSVRGAAAYSAATVSPDGRLVVTVDYHPRPYRVRVWDVRTGEGRILAAHDGQVMKVHFVDGGRKVLAVVHEDDACAHDLGTGREEYRTRHPVTVARGGARFAAHDERGRLIVYDAATGKPVARLKPPDPNAYRHSGPVALSDDGTQFVCHRSEYTAVWDLIAGKERVRLPSHRYAATAFGPGCRTVVFAGGGLWVMDAATCKELAGPDPTRGPPGGPGSFGWAPDGESVLIAGPAAGYPGTVFDPESGRVLRQLKPNSRATRWSQPGLHSSHAWWDRFAYGQPSVPFTAFKDAAGRPTRGHATASGDTRLLAVRSERPDYRHALAVTDSLPPFHRPTNCHDVAVHERVTGAELFKHTIPVLGEVAFSQDNRRLATLEPDRLRVWDAVTGRMLVEHKVSRPDRPPVGEGFGSALAFSPDNGRLAVNNRDGTILIWDVSTPDERKPLAAGELHRLWDDLAAPDPTVGWRAVHRLTDDLDQSTPFLIERLNPAAVPDGKTAKKLLAEMDSPDYRTREAAMRRGFELGNAGRPFAEAALNGASEPEVHKRLEDLRKMFRDGDPPRGDDLRRLRALAVLERSATKAARAKIEEMANGLPAARVTLEARHVRDRLAQDRAEKD